MRTIKRFKPRWRNVVDFGNLVNLDMSGFGTPLLSSGVAAPTVTYVDPKIQVNFDYIAANAVALQYLANNPENIVDPVEVQERVDLLKKIVPEIFNPTNTPEQNELILAKLSTEQAAAIKAANDLAAARLRLDQINADIASTTAERTAALLAADNAKKAATDAAAAAIKAVDPAFQAQQAADKTAADKAAATAAASNKTLIYIAGGVVAFLILILILKKKS